MVVMPSGAASSLARPSLLSRGARAPQLKGCNRPASRSWPLRVRARMAGELTAGPSSRGDCDTTQIKSQHL